MFKFMIILSVITTAIFIFISCSDDPPVAPNNDIAGYADSSEHLYASLQQSYGGEGADWGTAILPTDDNGFLITGSTDSYGTGKNTLYVVKIDSTGTQIFDTIYGGSGEDNAEAMVKAPDGSYTIGGVTSSFNGNYDFYLLNINANGSLNWEKSIGSDYFEWGTDLIALPDGYAMCGYQIPTGNTDGGNFYLIKTDLSGNLLWEKTFDRPDREWPFSLTSTYDGGFAIAGMVHYDGINNLDAFVIKTDDTGKVLWEETYGYARNEHVYSIIECADHSLIVNGSTRSFGGNNEELIYLFKTNSSGVLQWEKNYGTAGTIFGRSLIETTDGSLIFTGITNGILDGTGIVKTDANGNLLWNESIGLPGTGMSIEPHGDSKYLITGFAYDSLQTSEPNVLFICIEEK